jgi:hypothetical protein
MEVSSMEELDGLTPEQLWEVAADVGNNPEIRHAAISDFLFPDDEDDRLDQLLQLGTEVTLDDLPEEGNFQEMHQLGPFFDQEGNLIVEHDGIYYMIDPLDDVGDMFHEEDIDDLREQERRDGV